MAVHLPPPLNNVLSLWLPPDFVKTDENTLGYLLKQDTLTWETLVDTLHLFAENLLVPCSYPNPMPSRAHFHAPLPPLPSYFRPHVIYNFCAGLHPLMLQIEPGRSLDQAVERWALVQRIPQGGGADWFTAPVDARQAEALLEKLPDATSVLEAYAAKGDMFGHATPLSLQTIGKREHKVVPLGDAIVRVASQKASRWKEIRAQRRGGFGSIERGVATIERPSWTPSFSPTYDSSKTTGGGSYYSTLDAMHARAVVKSWDRRITAPRNVDSSWRGKIETDESIEAPSSDKGKEKTIDAVLEENEEIIRELEEWQEFRVRAGQESASEREHSLAHALFSSLATFTSQLKPSDLVQLMEGSAHDLSQRLIHTKSPSIQGTLDPLRRQALHDNITVRTRPQPKIPYTPPVSTPHRYQPPVQNSRPPPQGYNPNYRPPPSPYGYSGQPGVGGGSPYAGPGTPTSSYVRPGPGPSALRQSFGPGPVPGMGAPGGPMPSVYRTPGPPSVLSPAVPGPLQGTSVPYR